MKIVYAYQKNWCGVFAWIPVRKCHSFEHACKVASQLEKGTGVPHCVNS
jgi:hypothetical protein